MKNKLKPIGFAIICAGILCIVIKGPLPETIDADGMLHEAFFLLPVGFGIIITGNMFMLIGHIIEHIRKK